MWKILVTSDIRKPIVHDSVNLCINISNDVKARNSGIREWASDIFY